MAFGRGRDAEGTRLQAPAHTPGGAVGLSPWQHHLLAAWPQSALLNPSDLSFLCCEDKMRRCP